MQLNNFERPGEKTELENREATGLWKAIALAKELGEGTDEINLDFVVKINKTIFKDVVPESAGKFRVLGQDVEALPCTLPPPGVAVYGLMIQFGKDLKQKISCISHIPPHQDNIRNKKYRKWINSVIVLSAWVQHSLVSIHPFCDGNGRTARLMTNVILYRFNFRPTNVKMEGENKQKYINALCQIDKFGDYKPLQDLILAGSIETLKKELDRKRNSASSR